MRNPLALLCAAIFFALLISPAVVSEETYNLKPAFKAGLKLEVKQTTDSKFTLKMPGQDEKKSQELETINFAADVGDAADGLPTKINFAFTEYKNKTNDAGEESTTENELKGKTIEVTKNKEGEIVLPPDSQLSEQATQNLVNIFDMFSFTKNFPATAVPVGYKFEMNKDDFKKLVGADDAKGIGECVFEKLDTRNGIKCALVTINVDGTIEEEGNSTKFNSKASVWVSLENSIPVGIEMKVKIESAFEMPDENGDMQKGSMNVGMDFKYDVTVKK